MGATNQAEMWIMSDPLDLDSNPYSHILHRALIFLYILILPMWVKIL